MLLNAISSKTLLQMLFSFSSYSWNHIFAGYSYICQTVDYSDNVHEVRVSTLNTAVSREVGLIL